MSHIFISHSESDEKVVRDLCAGLEKTGFKVWFHERDSLPGATYLSQVAKALRECRAVIVVVSPRSLKSNEVSNEIFRAYQQRKPLMPVLLGVSHEEFLASREDWSQCFAAATSIAVPSEGASAIVPRIVEGLEYLGIKRGEEQTGSPAGPAPRPAPEPEPRRRVLSWLLPGIGAAVVVAVVFAVVLRPNRDDRTYGSLKLAARAWGQKEPITASVSLAGSEDDTSAGQKFSSNDTAVPRRLRPGTYTVDVSAPNCYPVTDTLEIVAESVVTREYRLLPLDYKIVLWSDEVFGIGQGITPIAKKKLAQVDSILKTDPWLRACVESSAGGRDLAKAAETYLKDSLKVKDYRFGDRESSDPPDMYNHIYITFFPAD